MRVEQMRFRYPTAAALVRSLIDDGTLTEQAVERIGRSTLEAIDSGLLRRQDAVAYLKAHERQYRRGTPTHWPIIGAAPAGAGAATEAFRGALVPPESPQHTGPNERSYAVATKLSRGFVL